MITELTQDWGTDSWRGQTKPCVHHIQEKELGLTTGYWPRLACECPGVSGEGVGQRWLAAGAEGLRAAVCA